MIPKASQRGLGQDLATHLLNAQDNEHLEVAEVRGAVARDLHGAFAEWEVHARGMIRCRNYLYSLSVNPHPARPLTRAQYMDFIERTEEQLGLSGQPRAVIFHIKDGREHCHVVWSRIDTASGKAVHLTFDHDKMMMVTREFARDHGLELPAGMRAGRDRDQRRRPLSLYEKHQEDTTGITREERMAHITQAWRQSDSPKAFVRALEHLGYILATGRRPYVLVDIYGHTNALPKMIDDRTVRTKDIRAFLEREFPPETLPGIEEAKELAAAHRRAIEDFRKAQAGAERLEALKRQQAERRRAVEREQAAMNRRQRQETARLTEQQNGERRAAKAAYVAEVRRVRLERSRNRPTGLAAFLGRVTGVQLVIRKLQRYRDKKRYEAFLQDKAALQERQAREQQTLVQRHAMQALDMQRRLRALDKVEQRELRSFETARVNDLRTRSRRGHAHMPAVTPEMRPPGRPAAPDKPRRRHASALARPLARAAHPERAPRPVDLSSAFARAAEDTGSGRGDRGGTGSPKPAAPSRTRVSRPRRRDRDIDRER